MSDKKMGAGESKTETEEGSGERYREAENTDGYENVIEASRAAQEAQAALTKEIGNIAKDKLQKLQTKAETASRDAMKQAIQNYAKFLRQHGEIKPDEKPPDEPTDENKNDLDDVTNPTKSVPDSYQTGKEYDRPGSEGKTISSKNYMKAVERYVRDSVASACDTMRSKFLDGEFKKSGQCTT